MPVTGLPGDQVVSDHMTQRKPKGCSFKAVWPETMRISITPNRHQQPHPEVGLYTNHVFAIHLGTLTHDQ